MAVSEQGRNLVVCGWHIMLDNVDEGLGTRTTVEITRVAAPASGMRCAARTAREHMRAFWQHSRWHVGSEGRTWEWKRNGSSLTWRMNAAPFVSLGWTAWWYSWYRHCILMAPLLSNKPLAIPKCT